MAQARAYLRRMQEEGHGYPARAGEVDTRPIVGVPGTTLEDISDLDPRVSLYRIGDPHVTQQVNQMYVLTNVQL